MGAGFVIELANFFKISQRQLVKFILCLILLSTQAFASVSKSEKSEATSGLQGVITKLALEPSGKLVSARVADEVGTRLIIEFTFLESVTSSKKCNYIYDRVLKRVIDESWICEI